MLLTHTYQWHLETMAAARHPLGELSTLKG